MPEVKQPAAKPEAKQPTMKELMAQSKKIDENVARDEAQRQLKALQAQAAK